MRQLPWLILNYESICSQCSAKRKKINKKNKKILTLTSLVRPQQQQASCCPRSMQCPSPSLKSGCTHTWACVPSGWCPRYGSFLMHLTDIKATWLHSSHIIVATMRIHSFTRIFAVATDKMWLDLHYGPKSTQNLTNPFKNHVLI